jgi:hypothetical protein
LVLDAIADDHLMSLLEWSPTVMVSAPAYTKVASWGVRVDVVVFDIVAHSNIVIEGVIHAGPAHVIYVNGRLADAVLLYLSDVDQNALQILVADPAKHFDEWADSDFQISLIDNNTKWSRIRSGRFEKWMPDESVLLVRADGRIDVSGGTFAAGQVSVLHAGLVSVASSSFFWIGEQHR